jgi:hypothetical protein
MWCCSSPRHNFIHLSGVLAVFSSCEAFMSDMGKLGRKRELLVDIRWTAASQTTRCHVLGWRALQVLVILQ